MKFRLNKQVTKDLENIKDKNVLIQVKKFLEEVKEASSVQELNRIKKIKGERNYYRYRFGDYRIGFKVEAKELLVLKIAHRKKIYRNFP